MNTPYEPVAVLSALIASSADVVFSTYPTPEPPDTTPKSGMN